MSAPAAIATSEGRAGRLCSIEDCGRKHNARGLCNMHYRRVERHGSLDIPPRIKDPQERLMARVIVKDEHWIWTGAKNPGGYGVIGAGARGQGNKLAHRLSYELFVGPIPEGLHIDHLCVTRLCVRPDHLEPVTQAENNRRERARIKEQAA